MGCSGIYLSLLWKKVKGPPSDFVYWKSNQNLIWFPPSFSLLISNLVMYQNICHFSRRLPEKVNFEIWVSLKVRCRDYEETCQARQLSAATWSQREFLPRRRRCTWFCSWFFLAMLHFILIGANLKTSHSLGCNFCCTLMFQLSTSMHWAISSPTSVDELVCRRLGYWFEHYC